MIQPTLLQIKTTDELTLPGMIYSAKRSKRAAIFLHGNGSSSVFYKDDMRKTMAAAFNRAGVSLLLFNNRGAHFIKTLHVKDKRKRFGMAYEKIKECIIDIDAAISCLKKLGYAEFYLIGESTGANKICVYHFYKPKNPVSKNILIGGGDDTGIYYSMLGKKKFFRLLEESKKNIKRGKGEQMISELLPDEFFSYQGFYDIANPDGDYNVFPFYEKMRNVRLSRKPLFRHFRSINKPTLVVYGSQDQYAWNNVPGIMDILKKLKPEFQYNMITGGDHSLSGHQRELGSIISAFLKHKRAQ
ncbi:MAG: DUF1749 domain-containing protein [Patescibacteria group bacterium]|jgi:pimeloyl-ACP methyl ester carboxylesterase